MHLLMVHSLRIGRNHLFDAYFIQPPFTSLYRVRFFPNGVCAHESAKAPLLFPFVPLRVRTFPQMSRVFILYALATTQLNEL
jgi:hypothetical protein